MKNKSITLRSIAALLIVLTLCVSVFACTSSETDDSKSDGGESITNVTNNTVTIEGTESDVAYATAAGLRSAVSVYCTFETTTGGGSFWNPVPTTQTYYSTGSGVIYKLLDDGGAFIVTNFHVVYDASANTKNHVSDKIYLYLYGMESEEYAIPASYVGGSANYDIAVLYVNESEVFDKAIASGSAAAAKIGDSGALTPGATTIAIGNPSATSLSGISATQGIVSVDSEYITMTAPDNSGEVAYRVIRTDTAVNSGNSGGGLYNDRGELIGIVNAKITSSSVENIGYAIPVGVARAIADNIIDYCYGKDNESVMRALLGVTLTVDGMSTKYDTETGLLQKVETIGISAVTSGSAADGQLKEGDIIKSLTLNDKTVTVTRQYHLIDTMLDARVGDTVIITVERDGQEVTASFTVTEELLTAY